MKTPQNLPRREFLKRSAFLTAAGAALPSMFPSRVLGANDRIQVGVIGVGGRGDMIAQFVEEHGGFQITAVADYFPEVAQAAGERHGVPKERRFSGLMGYKRLLESKVEAVFLETPPYCFVRPAGRVHLKV